MTSLNYDLARARAYFEDRVSFSTGSHELQILIERGVDQSDYQVVDVRFPADYAKCHVPGAINLPMPKWNNARFLAEHLRKDAILYLYCYTPTCHMASEAAVKLTVAGYKVVELEGGWSNWKDSGYAVETQLPNQAAA